MGNTVLDPLIIRMTDARSAIETLIPRIDPCGEIFPGWTLKDLLAHLTGWDEVVVLTLTSHLIGESQSIPPILNLNTYNARSVSSRKNLRFTDVYQEWQFIRSKLMSILEQFPQENLLDTIMVPWGGELTINSLVEIFIEHEQIHFNDLQTWLASQKPLSKKEG
jgi:hypothetical protein